jgi:hypothetical protein
VRAVERGTRQPRVVGVALPHLDLRQTEVGREVSRELDEVRAAVEAKNVPGRTDPLAQQVKDSTRAASEVDHPLAGPYPGLRELRVGQRREIGDLSLEPKLFRLAAPEQVDIRLRHRVPFKESATNLGVDSQRTATLMAECGGDFMVR